MNEKSFEHFLYVMNKLYKENHISIEDLKTIIILKQSNNTEEKITNILNIILNLINENTIIFKNDVIKEKKYLNYFMNEKSRKIRELQDKGEKGEKKL